MLKHFFILPGFTHSLASVLKVHLMSRGGVGAAGAGDGWEVGGVVIGRAVPDDKCITYSNFRKYAHPLHVKEGIITEKVFLVFSESFF